VGIGADECDMDSLLDCFRSSRPPCPAPQGRGSQDLLQGRPARCGFLCCLLRYPPVRQAPAPDDDQGVPGGVQRIRQGMHPAHLSTLHGWDKTNNKQQERINPIHGISKEGYEGKGFVQSPPAEKE